MKKIAIFLLIVVIIICIIFGLYINYKTNYNIYRKENLEFETYLNKEIYGAELVTVINKAINKNEQNAVDKDNKGIYLNNDENSIKIEIMITDNDTIYPMEIIYNGGTQNFISNYRNIQFKCVDIKYHDTTHKVKYMLFEQITE